MHHVTCHVAGTYIRPSVRWCCKGNMEYEHGTSEYEQLSPAGREMYSHLRRANGSLRSRLLVAAASNLLNLGTRAQIRKLGTVPGVGGMSEFEVDELYNTIQCDGPKKMVYDAVTHAAARERCKQNEGEELPMDDGDQPPEVEEQFNDALFAWAMAEVDSAAAIGFDAPAGERLQKLHAVGRTMGVPGCGQGGLEYLLQLAGEHLLPAAKEWLLQADESQLAAVEAAVQAPDRSWTLITGGAGTGKSFVLCIIYSIMQAQGKKVLMCASTNAAAEVLRARGIPAETINSSMGLGYHDDHTADMIFEWLFNKKDKGYWPHQKARGHWQEDDLEIILDEASMLDEVLRILLHVMDRAVRDRKYGTVRTKRIRFIIAAQLTYTELMT